MRIEIKTLDGFIVNENKIINIKIDFSRFSPSVILSLTIPMINNAKGYHSIKVFYKDKILFQGNILKQQEIESSNGRLLEIKALNIPSQMLFNQPLPSNGVYITNEILLSKYVSQFGISKIGFNGSKAIYPKIKKGTNYWDFLNYCCINMYNKECYMNGDNEIVLEPFTNNSHIISSITDRLKPIEIKKRYNKERAISTLNIINGKRPNGDYNYFVTENEEARTMGIKREIYGSVNSNLYNQIDLSKRIIRDSNLDLISFDVLLCGIKDIGVGDAISLTYNNVTYRNLYVAMLSYNANNKIGITTKLCLYDKKFLR